MSNRIITVCGSMLFFKQMREVAAEFTGEGWIVLAPFVAKDGMDDASLESLHLDKIELSQAIVVVSVGGYVGESTRREISYAASRGLSILWRDVPRDDDIVFNRNEHGHTPEQSEVVRKIHPGTSFRYTESEDGEPKAKAVKHKAIDSDEEKDDFWNDIGSDRQEVSTKGITVNVQHQDTFGIRRALQNNKMAEGFLYLDKNL